MKLPKIRLQPGEASTATGPVALMPLVVILFFVWGFITVLNDPLIAKLKGLFSLTYAEVMLTQFAFFIGYFVFSVPAGIVLAKLGYARAIVVGLVVMAIGCALFAPAAMSGQFAGFLIALFCVAAGITMLQVAANPFIATLGSAKTASSRLTLAQAFNSLGTFIGPFVGAIYFLKQGVGVPVGADEAALRAARIAGGQLLFGPFLVIAGLLLLFALFFWMVRNVRQTKIVAPSLNPFRRSVLGRPRLVLGVLCIFLYVGAEVSIGSGLTNYLMQTSVIGTQAGMIGRGAANLLSRFGHSSVSLNVAQVAGALVSIYWGLAMVGRFIGSVALARILPGKVLRFNALVAVVLALMSAALTGIPAAVAVLAIGLANSVMFPTIFTLALEDLGEDTPHGSALLCMGIVGGAIIPLIFGAVADRVGLAHALVVPAACYLLIGAYGWFVLRGRVGQKPT